MRHAIKVLGLTSVLALSACGGGSGGSGVREFVGTWRATAGTTTTVCPGYTPVTEPVGGNIVWSAGVGSDLVATEPLSGCVIMADVTGSTATGIAGQTCSGSSADGSVSTLSFGGYTFVLSPDGHTATENLSGTVTVVVQGASLVCSVSQSGSYQKIGN